MKHANLNDWQTILHYLIDANDAPTAAKTDAQHALTVHARATKQHSEEQHYAHATLQTLHTLERDLPTQAWDNTQNGKRLNLDTVLRHLDQTRQANSTAQTRAQLTKQVLLRAESLVTGGCLHNHHPALLHWIANRRNAAPHKCGHVETLPDQVQVIYNHIQPIWWNQWDEGLHLNAISRLPLIYDPTWDADIRASLAWVWEQVATGNVDTIPHPHARNPETAQRVLVPTRRFIQLPQVPPALNAPNRR